MKKLEHDLNEIGVYVENWRPSHPQFDNHTIRALVRSSYRQFHAVLVWGMALESSTIEDQATRTYFTEALSDLSHAYFLNLCSMYKSARSSLRSAIENVIRVVLLHRRAEIASLTSVYDMFSRAKKEYKSDIVSLRLINKFHVSYGELCKSVHSATTDYLSLAVPFERLSVFDVVSFADNDKKIGHVSSLINQWAFWVWTKLLRECGHVNLDLVSDALPRSIKRAKYDALLEGDVE